MFSITGTYRVAAILLTRWVVAGRSTARLAREYPDLTTADLRRVRNWRQTAKRRHPLRMRTFDGASWRFSGDADSCLRATLIAAAAPVWPTTRATP